MTWPKPDAPPSSPQAILALISRVLDGAPTAGLFQVSLNANLSVNGKDVFELSNGSAPGSIAITASSGVAAAMGFNYYLKYVADSSGRICAKNSNVIVLFLLIVYWSGKNIQTVRSSLIPISQPIRIVANDLFRWYGNPCTFSYSAVFWNFTR